MTSAKRVIWAPKARQDLTDVWRHYARVASPEIADKISRDISKAADGLSRMSLPGRSRDDLVSGMRSLPVHPHTVFFRVASSTIEIVRVLHERRDFRAIFPKLRP